MFGTFIKELRMKQRLGLREFCLKYEHDPSNWSKIEREVLSPPSDEAMEAGSVRLPSPPAVPQDLVGASGTKVA